MVIEGLLLIAQLHPINTLEEPTPEIYLQPRNFNPHPYQVNVVPRRNEGPNRGPILFPPSPPPETEESNFIRIDSKHSRHPIDDHPYPKLALRYRPTNPGRYQDNENKIDPQISGALANHARKILRPSSVNGYLPISPINDQKNYEFSYKVVDHLTGDDFSHTQSQSEKATSGEYRVKLPDGRVQIVSYTADKNGYKADVKYQDDDEPLEKTNLLQRHDSRNQIESYRNGVYNSRVKQQFLFDSNGNRDSGTRFGVASTIATPIYENTISNYDNDREKQVLYTPGPTESSNLIYQDTQLNYNGYQQTIIAHHIASTPSPTVAYRNVHEDVQRHRPEFEIPHRFRIIPHGKVQIVNQGSAFVSSTAAPSYLENPGIIISSTAPPPSFSGDYQRFFVTGSQDFHSKRK